MKNLFFLVFFFSLNFYSQNSFILKKDGTKIEISDKFNDFEIINIDKRISYVIPGKTWEKYITYKDLDYASFGQYVFKSFIIEKKQKGYFVLAEDVDKRLVCLVTSVTTQQGKSLYSTITYYDILVLDLNNNIIETLDFKGTNKSLGHVELRKKVPELIKRNFKNCPKVIERMESFNTNDEYFMDILGFFDSPVYLKCN
ncbi:hypothetical protein ACFSJW_18895 [Flavobacterium artemisiae]|uniref:DUF4468 domain-containing protein n=1 Tax=Flavobacterium artemisiae TaxID=2126556 RepID=A0ABW4HCX7_9FLAO